MRRELKFLFSRNIKNFLRLAYMALTPLRILTIFLDVSFLRRKRAACVLLLQMRKLDRAYDP